MFHLRVTFIALLVSVVLFGLSARDVEAGPIAKRRPSNKMFSIPLKRMERVRDVHPQIMLQQNINRSRRRHARMTGRTIPTDQELREALNKRIESLDIGPDGLSKRFNRAGAKSTGKRDLSIAEFLEKKAIRVGMAGGRVEARHGGGHSRHGNNNKDNTDDAEDEDTSCGNSNGNATETATAIENPTATDVSASESAVASEDPAASEDAGATATDTAAAADETVAADEGDVAPADSVTASEDPATENSVAFDIEGQDIGYLASVQIGTPPRNFELLMDSGSADTWVGGEACQSEIGGGCGNHEFLGATSSSTFQQSTSQFQVTYGTGAVAGTIIADNLAVAGLSLEGHVFGAADIESVEFSDDSTSFDGLMGLAQSTLSNQQTLTPPEAMAAAGLIDQAIVSYKIPRLADALLDGEVTFGGLDETKFDPATLVTLDNVSPDGFWEAAMDAATVDGTDTGLAGRTAILDTGTTLILAPEDDAIAIHQLIEGATTDGQGSFTVPCTTTASIALTFGGQEFTIDSRDLAFVPVDPTDPEGDCISGISAGNIGGATEWLIGDVFLKNAYFSHNVDDNTMSLAKLV